MCTFLSIEDSSDFHWQLTFPWWVILKHRPSCINSELHLMAFSFWTQWIRWDYFSSCISFWSLVIVWNYFAQTFFLFKWSAKTKSSWAVSCIKTEWISSVLDTVTISIFRDVMIEALTVSKTEMHSILKQLTAWEDFIALMKAWSLTLYCTSAFDIFCIHERFVF